MKDYIVNEKFCDKLYEEYMERHSNEFEHLDLKKQDAIYNALIICLERLVNKRPIEIIKEAADEWLEADFS